MKQDQKTDLSGVITTLNLVAVSSFVTYLFFI